MSKILFIVEGENDEEKYINRLFHASNKLQKYEIVPYKTNIHTLVKLIFNKDTEEIDEYLDIRQVLKSQENNPDIKEKLSQDFSDIILVFDFEPHEKNPHFDLIRKMLQFFNDSTENGKLYINYPMMQSYRHFSYLPDYEFKDVKVTKEESHDYKRIVNELSNYKNVSHHKYDLFITFAYHHLLKLNYILNNKFELPNINLIYDWKQIDLFDIQLKMLENQNMIYVINTFSLFIIEYNPTEFYNQVTTHKAKYNI